jgi:hypothetical protein
MKETLLISLTFCLLSTAFAQNKQVFYKKQDTINLFCQHWVLTTMSAQGKSGNVPSSEAMYVTYKADGSYTDSSARFGVSHGTWTYESKTQLLYVDGNRAKVKTKIAKLASDELVMEIEYPTLTVISTYKRVD